MFTQEKYCSSEEKNESPYELARLKKRERIVFFEELDDIVFVDVKMFTQEITVAVRKKMKVRMNWQG
jgi:hypothetical protein